MVAIRPAGEVQLKNYGLDVLLLPQGSRVVSPRTITVSVAAVAGAMTLSLISSVAATIVRAGTCLSFAAPTGNRIRVMTTAEATLATTATVVPVVALDGDITTTHTATFFSGLTPVFGIQDFGGSFNPTTVDTTNSQSGTGMESAVVRMGRTMEISLIQIPNDRALFTIIKPLAHSVAFMGREMYAVATMPNGEQKRGAAKITAFSEPGGQNEVMRTSFTMEFQGDSYEYIAPYAFT